jgi:hypothetical protein
MPPIFQAGANAAGLSAGVLPTYEGQPINVLRDDGMQIKVTQVPDEPSVDKETLGVLLNAPNANG